jgi:hypothetical protein
MNQTVVQLKEYMRANNIRPLTGNKKALEDRIALFKSQNFGIEDNINIYEKKLKDTSDNHIYKMTIVQLKNFMKANNIRPLTGNKQILIDRIQSANKDIPVFEKPVRKQRAKRSEKMEAPKSIFDPLSVAQLRKIIRKKISASMTLPRKRVDLIAIIQNYMDAENEQANEITRKQQEEDDRVRKIAQLKKFGDDIVLHKHPLLKDDTDRIVEASLAKSKSKRPEHRVKHFQKIHEEFQKEQELLTKHIIPLVESEIDTTSKSKGITIKRKHGGKHTVKRIPKYVPPERYSEQQSFYSEAKQYGDYNDRKLVYPNATRYMKSLNMATEYIKQIGLNTTPFKKLIKEQMNDTLAPILLDFLYEMLLPIHRRSYDIIPIYDESNEELVAEDDALTQTIESIDGLCDIIATAQYGLEDDDSIKQFLKDVLTLLDSPTDEKNIRIVQQFYIQYRFLTKADITMAVRGNKKYDEMIPLVDEYIVEQIEKEKKDILSKLQKKTSSEYSLKDAMEKRNRTKEQKDKDKKLRYSGEKPKKKSKPDPDTDYEDEEEKDMEEYRKKSASERARRGKLTASEYYAMKQ